MPCTVRFVAGWPISVIGTVSPRATPRLAALSSFSSTPSAVSSVKPPCEKSNVNSTSASAGSMATSSEPSVESPTVPKLAPIDSTSPTPEFSTSVTSSAGRPPMPSPCCLGETM